MNKVKARALRREPVKQAYSLRANHPLYGWPRFCYDCGKMGLTIIYMLSSIQRMEREVHIMNPAHEFFIHVDDDEKHLDIDLKKYDSEG